MPFVALVALAVLAQDPPRIAPADERREAFLSVSRKYAGADTVGLYLLSLEGGTRRIWDGEPYDARALPDRSVLVVERWTGRVLGFDREGEQVFAASGIAEPVDVELAADGSILVVANGANAILVLDPETGAVRRRFGGLSDPFDAAPLPDGGILVADSGRDRVLELGPDGAERWSIRTGDFPNTVERLANGNTLVTFWSSGEVHEYDRAGRRTWSVDVGGTVYRALRLPDGDTLVCDGGGGRLVRVGPDGATKSVERFQPRCVDYEPVLDF